MSTNRFVVAIRTAPATSSRGGRYRRPVHVRVLDTTRSEWHAVRGLNDGVRAEFRNVDSRYSGERAAYGQALRAARVIAARLNAEIEAAHTYEI